MSKNGHLGPRRGTRAAPDVASARHWKARLYDLKKVMLPLGDGNDGIGEGLFARKGSEG